MGVSVGNETTIAAKQNFSDLAKKLFVMPGHYVVYRIGLQSGTDEGEFHASVFVSTEFEELRVPFRFRVAKGSLSMQNQDVSFEPTFPVRFFSVCVCIVASINMMTGMEDLLFHHLTNLHLSLTSNCPGNQLCYVETSHGLCTASVPASRWPRPETNNGPVSKAALCPVQPPPGFLISELRQLGLICNAFL